MSDRPGGDLVEARLERILGDVLRSRDPGPAPVTLRRQVDRVPAETPVERRGMLRRMAPWMAAAAAVVLVAGVAGTLAPLAAPPGAGSVGSTSAISCIGQPGCAFDPYATGLGVVEAPNQVLIVLVVALLTLVAFYGAGVTSGRKSGALAVLFVVIPGLFLVTQVLRAPVAGGGGYSTESGLTDGTELGYTYGPVPGGVVTVSPGEPYRFVVAVTNRGPLPLRLDGLVANPASTPGVTDLPSLWLGRDPETSWNTPDTPFTPQWLAPGDAANLWVVQRASSCTVAPGAGVASSTQSAIDIRWSVLGVVPRLDPLELPFLVDTPMSMPCPKP